MPYYTFINKKTGKKRKPVLMGISEMENYLEEHPELTTAVSGPAFLGDPIRQGLKKPSNAFRDVLKNIKHKLPGSTINTWVMLLSLGATSTTYHLLSSLCNGSYI